MADAEDVSVDTDAAKIARRWMTALQDCDKWMENYWERCKRIIRRYRNERPMGAGNAPPSPDIRRFAVLWSNTETLKPAVYARTPQPVVSRRYRDADPVGRYASEVLERALSFSLDQYEFDDHIKLALTDYLLLARGTVWVRYIPHKAVDEASEDDIEEDGPSITETADVPTEIPYAETVCDHVAYNNWGVERCRSWDEAGFVWRRVFMTRKELIERFGRKIGGKVPLDYSPASDPTVNSEEVEKVKKAAIYEIWCKDDRKVYWLSRSFPTQCLDIKDDWLKLTGFFPTPRPLTGTIAPDSYIPVPDYVQYQDQADELDELTQRIGSLTDGLKMIGVYAGEEQATLQNLFMQPTGTMVPIKSMASWTDKGGFKGLVEWMPIEVVAETLTACFAARKEILDNIYQITGMSDIIRGMSDPRETATAQQMKGNWGSLRVRDKQKEIERFARDVLRLQAEIIAGQFGVSTLKAMTDVKMFDTQQQKQAVQQAAQSGLPPPPGANVQELQMMLGRPTWEEVNALLKDTSQRLFRVDVETDSTIEPDQQEEKAARVEFVGAMSQLFAGALPFLQSAPQMAPVVGQTAMFLARGFRVGREMEDVLEKTFDQLLQNPPQIPAKPGEQQANDPQAAQVQQMKTQAEGQKAQAGIQTAQLSAQAAAIKAQADVQIANIKAQSDAQMAQLQVRDQQLEHNDQQLRLVALNKDPKPQAVSNG